MFAWLNSTGIQFQIMTVIFVFYTKLAGIKEYGAYIENASYNRRNWNEKKKRTGKWIKVVISTPSKPFSFDSNFYTDFFAGWRQAGDCFRRTLPFLFLSSTTGFKYTVAFIRFLELQLWIDKSELKFQCILCRWNHRDWNGLIVFLLHNIL